MENNRYMKLIALFAGLLCVFLLIAFPLRAMVKTLSPAPALGGQIEQAILTNESQPIAGQDFQLETQYFSNNTWAVVHIKPSQGSNLNEAYAILQKKSGVFQVVVSPTTSFPSDYSYSLPTDVTTYLSGEGLL